MKIFRLSLLFLVLCLWGCSQGYLLVLTDVTDRENPTPLTALPVRQGEAFKISYIHSWDLTPVTDILLVGKDGSIVIEEEIFDWFGAGLEHNPPRGRLFVGPDKRIHVKGIGREVETLRLRVGIVAQHLLQVRDLKIALDTLTQPMNAIEFRIVAD